MNNLLEQSVIAERLIDVFVDEDIPTQTRWDEYLTEKVKESEMILCLIAPETRLSEIVQAIESGSKIIFNSVYGL